MLLHTVPIAFVQILVSKIFRGYPLLVTIVGMIAIYIIPLMLSFGLIRFQKKLQNTDNDPVSWWQKRTHPPLVVAFFLSLQLHQHPQPKRQGGGGARHRKQDQAQPRRPAAHPRLYREELRGHGKFSLDKNFLLCYGIDVIRTKESYLWREILFNNKSFSKGTKSQGASLCLF